MQYLFWISSAAYSVYFAYTGALSLLLGSVFEAALPGSELNLYSQFMNITGYLDLVISGSCIAAMVLHFQKKPVSAKLWVVTLAIVAIYEVGLVVINLASISLARDLILPLITLWVFLRGVLGWRKLYPAQAA